MLLLLLLFGVHQLQLPSHDFLSSFDSFFNVFIVLNIIIVLVKNIKDKNIRFNMFCFDTLLKFHFSLIRLFASKVKQQQNKRLINQK